MTAARHSADPLPQRAISSSVREQPTHSPLSGSMSQMLTQGLTIGGRTSATGQSASVSLASRKFGIGPFQPPSSTASIGSCRSAGAG